MSNYNSEYNNVVWVDIPVADLDRSIAFYSAVLGTPVSKEEMEGFTFGVFMHEQGNGGCLVLKEGEISSSQGILVYMNVNGRIRDAVAQVDANGGNVMNEIHSIGPHGFRAIVIDSEGNRLALHSETDA
jgi:predicted enzyme related to lactoylglutathione lyase